MTTGQDPVYTPVPISQRDGTALANSNCRMASIATGLDYHTRGGDKSTGAKMRSYTSDQSGGTDSGDAVEAWRNGYAETLTVRDGYTFDNLIQDLGKGSAVHLDVWHASAGGPCLSGSGAYGHTMFVLPDQHSDGARWKVADPWCSPGSWSWWPESKLRAGAEEWGRRVYGTAVEDADWPTGGDTIGDPRHPVALAIIRRIVRLLMDAAYPGAEAPGPGPRTPPDWGETGGGKPILFTRTAALGTAGGGSSSGGDDMARFVQANGYSVGSGKLLKMKTGEAWEYLDGSPGGTFSADTNLTCFGLVDASSSRFLVALSTGAPYADGSPRTTLVAVPTSADPYPAPAPTPPPDSGGGDLEEELAERDQAWRDWLLAGSPGEDPEA